MIIAVDVDVDLDDVVADVDVVDSVIISVIHFNNFFFFQYVYSSPNMACLHSFYSSYWHLFVGCRVIFCHIWMGHSLVSY